MRFGILGALECRDGDTVVEIPGDRVRRLAARLLVDVGRPVSTTELVEAVWADEPPTQVANALQSLVSRLRRSLGHPELVQQTAQGYRLDASRDDVDAYRFLELARQGRAALHAGEPGRASELLSTALGLWRGEPLADAGDAVYAITVRVRWDDEHLLALTDRIDADISRGLSRDLVSEVEQLVAEHPHHEALVGLQMRALTAAGRPADALAAYERLRESLAEELGADPGASLQQLHLALLRGESLGGVTPAAGESNLPTPLTSFIGREADAKRLNELLRQGRLATVVGPGGAGKTRLATEVAQAWRDHQPDGVWLVELAPVADEQGVVGAVLDALGMREVQVLDRQTELSTAGPLERVVSRLSGARCLLVVDNCEHVLDDAAGVVARILAASPGVRVIATSREPLGIDGEALCVLSPLAMPGEDADVASALEQPSVRLFVERAEAVDAAFVLDEATVAPVVQIVRRLDGLPLAIELAAARLRVLPVTEVVERLADRFRLLTGGSRTAMPRHRTLRAVVEWSWELLTPPERALAERLAVFPSGATVESATAVCAGGPVEPDAVPELLGSLVDKSLLRRADDHRLRYRMLETLREYGIERLTERGEVEAVRSAHARHFLDVAEAQDPVLRTPGQLDALATFEAERDNLSAAMRYLGDAGEADACIRLVLAMSWYWTMLGGHADAARWLQFAAAADGDASPRSRAAVQALLSIYEMAVDDGRADGPGWDERVAAIREANAALEAFEPNPDTMIVVIRPLLAFFSGDIEQAVRLNERASTHEDPWIRCAVRTFQAAIYENEGQLTEMRADIDAALAELAEIGDRWLLGSGLTIRARVRTLDGDLRGAIADFEAARDLIAQIQAHDDQAFVGMRLADLRMRVGDLDEAERVIDRTFREGGSSNIPAEIFEAAMRATLAHHRGDEAAAGRLLEGLRESLPDFPREHPMHGHARAIAMVPMAVHDIAVGELGLALDDLTAAYAGSLGTRDMPIVASVGVVTASLHAALGRPVDAAEVLGAAAALRGSPDDTDLDVAELTARLRDELGDGFTAAYETGRSLDREAALQRLDPDPLRAALVD